MKNIDYKIKFISNKIYKYNYLLYDESNKLYKKGTINNGNYICTNKKGVFKLYIYDLDKCYLINVYLYKNDVNIYLNDLYKFVLIDRYSKVPIEKGELILWQRNI